MKALSLSSAHVFTGCRRVLRQLLVPVFALSLLGCREAASPEGVRAPLPQRAYIWQRDWSAPVGESLKQAPDTLAGVVVLAAEVEWRDRKPRAIRPDVSWETLRHWGRPVSVALRIAPYPGPFAADDTVVQELCAVATRILAEAREQQVKVAEFQLDFDCAQKKLAGYRQWVRRFRDTVQPVPLVITTLPSWLGEAEFLPLIREVPRYVLQVHSVSSPLGDSRTAICDPDLARAWVSRAEAIGHPFEIALPTYRSVLGYGPDGRLLGVSSDGVQPSWPAGTVVRDYETDAEAMAALVHEWTQQRLLHLQGLLWYRLPVGSDVNNWRWPTLRAVMAGRVPADSWRVVVQGNNPADLTLRNEGETDRPFTGRVEVRWTGAARPTVEALPGWRAVVMPEAVVFTSFSSRGQRLPPGSERAMGWVRLEPAVSFHAQAYP